MSRDTSASGSEGCHTVVSTADDSYEFVPIEASHGANCDTAINVIYLFASRLSILEAHQDCYHDLCTGTPLRFAGYSCRGKLVGDSAWTVNCRRGRKRVFAYSAD